VVIGFAGPGVGIPLAALPWKYQDKMPLLADGYHRLDSQLTHHFPQIASNHQFPQIVVARGVHALFGQ
jgi:hypothetical protein